MQCVALSYALFFLCSLPRNKTTQATKGFAFIEFLSKEEALKAANVRTVYMHIHTCIVRVVSMVCGPCISELLSLELCPQDISSLI